MFVLLNMPHMGPLISMCGRWATLSCTRHFFYLVYHWKLGIVGIHLVIFVGPFRACCMMWVPIVEDLVSIPRCIFLVYSEMGCCLLDITPYPFFFILKNINSSGKGIIVKSVRVYSSGPCCLLNWRENNRWSFSFIK